MTSMVRTVLYLKKEHGGIKAVITLTLTVTMEVATIIGTGASREAR